MDILSSSKRIAPMSDLPREQPFELINRFMDPATGLVGYIAIHSTVRGPAFGGCRLWMYDDDQKALADAKRLAEGMSYKNALAELPFGGGKAVIIRPPTISDRAQLFRAFGRAVARLRGSYITAEDVGTTPDDMKAVRAETKYVSGIPRADGFGGDPSRFTALGVFLSIQTAVGAILRRDSLKGVKVAVQGAGAVGTQLCSELAKAGAELWISDIDLSKADLVREVFGAHLVSSEDLLRMKVDVFAPCAVDEVLTADVIDRLNAPIVAGAANNQLASIADGDRLHERGIWYLPDFMINAGGIIAVAHEYLGTGSEDRVLERVECISERVEKLIAEVRRTDEPPARIALAWAKALV